MTNVVPSPRLLGRRSIVSEQQLYLFGEKTQVVPIRRLDFQPQVLRVYSAIFSE